MTPPDAHDSRWSDLDRPPLNAASLRRALVRPGTLFSSLEVVASTGSTNTDLAGRASTLSEGAVLVAEEQTAGRGRLDRRWSAPPRSGLFFSVLLKPAVPVRRWGWLPLLAGVATATAVSRTAGVDTALKWPNDLLVMSSGQSGRLPAGGTPIGTETKAGGILVEWAPGGAPGRAGRADKLGGAEGVEEAGSAAVVLGIGLNVTLRADELPVPTAGSLALAGATATDRDPLLRAVLRSLETWYRDWSDAHGDPVACGLQETYVAGCATLGRTVRAELPGDRSVTGEAVALDGDGRLVLATEGGVRQPVEAGDIVHLREAGTGDG